MNFKFDLTTEQQKLLSQINYSIEDKEYSSDEIRNCISTISDHCMSLSSKNGDLSKEMLKYDGLMKVLLKNEK